jgi:hypothetical protein
MRYRWLLALVGLVASLSLVPSAPAHAVGDALCFRETGHCVLANFRTFWERNGGARIFGLPIQDQIATTIRGRRATTQLFERARFEQYTDVRSAAIMLGRVGAEALELRGVNWQDYAPSYDPNAVRLGNCQRYSQTDHAVCYGFRQFYNRNGGLRIFGLPLTDEFVEGDRIIQWFERGRFEAGNYEGAPVELAPVGSEINV